MVQKEFRSLSQSEIQSLTKAMLHEHMGRLSVRERGHQAEVVAAVCEVARRRLYFDHGFTSLFDYMTKGLEFPNASAQRYIDAARLCAVVPTLNEDIARGEVNLSQVTLVAKTVRQKSKEQAKFKMEVTQATELFQKIKGEDIRASQQIIAQELKVEIKEQDLARVQANGSVRHEITLSPEQEALFQRIKELISHTHLNPTFADVFEYLANEYRKRKDPLVAQGRPVPESQETRNVTQAQFNLEVQPRQTTSAARRTPIPARTLHEVHQRDRSCRYRDPMTGRTCDSTFQLQADHIQPIWAGGSNSLTNLQLLCSAHNRLKYRNEVGIQHGKDLSLCSAP